MVVSRKRLISVRVNLVCYSFSDRPISRPIPGFVSYFRLPVVDDVWSRNSHYLMVENPGLLLELELLG